MKQYKYSELNNMTERLYQDFNISSNSPFADREQLMKKYFKMAICVGFDIGRKPHTNQKAVLKIKNGKIVHRYDSVTQAANAEGCDVSTISAAIKKRYNPKSLYKGFEYRLYK